MPSRVLLLMQRLWRRRDKDKRRKRNVDMITLCMNEVLDHVLIDAATTDTAQIIKSSQGDTGMAHTARRVQTSTSFAHVAAKINIKEFLNFLESRMG